MSNDHLPILVGLDGSPEQGAVLDWATTEAQSRGVLLRLVYVVDPTRTYFATQLYGAAPLPVSARDSERATDIATKTLEAAAGRVAARAPGVPVRTQLYDGESPVEVLLRESAQARTIVLGSRRMGAVGSIVLGSVGATVAARASCPVVVLRGPAGLVEEQAGVVVGVDGRAPSETALAYAFDFASRRSLPLTAVLCWHLDPLAQALWRPAAPVPTQVEAWLSEAMAGWREEYPDVPVHAEVVRDHPVSGLVAISAAQYLLVVGNRGHHALPGTLLGSVSQGVLHHAGCPVAVVPLPAS
ncbi:universal stress protein [Cumulibacter manganitolerans]|uniref:universal stress protein n=1 Tax=Cumulibacter manganitolerans TaxID=1884992 RepID=UPI00129697C8|nr:universal stress protein [Cumulibacter manganitolerans]